MSKRILAVDKSIIIYEIFLASIVRRVDVDNINLARVGVRQLRECGEIVALDNEMIGSVRVIGNYRVDFIIVALDEDREVFAKAFLDVFGLFFPHKPELLITTNEFKQR